MALDGCSEGSVVAVSAGAGARADGSAGAIAQDFGLDAAAMSPAGRDSGLDARVADPKTLRDAAERDGGADGPAAGAGGAMSADAGPCAYPFDPVYSVCLAAAPLTSDAPLTMQDTADGARGDCAVHASGPGGRNRYYTLTLPRGQYARVTATVAEPTQAAVVRALSDCHAPKAESGARGMNGGRAVMCVRNETDADREVVIAVGHYSGESGDLTLVFDLSVELIPIADGCLPF